MTKTIPKDLPTIPAPPTDQEVQAQVFATWRSGLLTDHFARVIHGRVAKPAQALVDILSARITELEQRLEQKEREVERAADIIDEQAKALIALRRGETVGTETSGPVKDSTDPQQVDLEFEMTVIQLNCFARIS